MARPTHAPPKVRNISVRTKSNPIKEASGFTTPDDPLGPLQALRISIADLAFDIHGEVGHLREAHHAFGCLEHLLVPLEIERIEESYITANELRTLLALVKAEFGRRIEAIEVAVEGIRTTLAPPSLAEDRARWEANGG